MILSDLWPDHRSVRVEAGGNESAWLQQQHLPHSSANSESMAAMNADSCVSVVFDSFPTILPASAASTPAALEAKAPHYNRGTVASDWLGKQCHTSLKLSSTTTKGSYWDRGN